MYDIAPDGQRFLMIKPGGGSESTPEPTSLVVVQHFDEELKRLLPVEVGVRRLMHVMNGLGKFDSLSAALATLQRSETLNCQVRKVRLQRP